MLTLVSLNLLAIPCCKSIPEQSYRLHLSDFLSDSQQTFLLSWFEKHAKKNIVSRKGQIFRDHICPPTFLKTNILCHKGHQKRHHQD